MTDLPILPYAGTSGWSGGETSRERADELDTSGRTASYQRDALQYLLEAGHQGLTYTELNDVLGCRTQTGAAVLSILHKEGLITRLSARRNRCQIYVLHEYVEGREQVPHRPHSKAKPSPELPEGWEYAVLHIVHPFPDVPSIEKPTALDRFPDGHPSFMDEDCKRGCLLVMVQKRPRIADLILDDEDPEDDPDWHPCVLTGQFTAKCQGECRA